jgi:peptidoglycan/LPS O-acetylase OafA/YrhL
VATAGLILERDAARAEAWRLPVQIPELDGIRGIAILLVMICHSGMWLPDSTLLHVLRQGKMGVDLFFVLSGFLITRILLDARGQAHARRNFYIRRGLRIWPLYFAYLTLAFVVFRRILPPHFSPWAHLLFVQNLFYFSGMGPFLDPAWSLAVEEQFYLVWPWLAFSLRRETLLRICAAVLMLSPVLRCVLNLRGADYNFIYNHTLCRLDGIALGSAIACWVGETGFDPSRLRGFARWAVPVGTAGYVLCNLTEPAFRFAIEVRYSFTALAFGGVVCLALYLEGAAGGFARVLRTKPLTYLGRISFALYLFNFPIYTIMHGNYANRVFSGLDLTSFATTLLRFAVENAVLLVAASCSWVLFESQVLRLKGKLAPR